MNPAELARRFVKPYLPDTAWLVLRTFVRGADCQWMRIVMNQDIESYLRALDVGSLSAVEISGAGQSSLPWARYEVLDFPDFDLCDRKPVSRKYDVVICEQVLEHVVDPMSAVAKLADMLRPDGLLVVSTPFLVRLHYCPGDYWRFTPDGMRLLLEAADLTVERIGRWGNRACISRDLRSRSWTGRPIDFSRMRPWRPLRNEAETPSVVWAFARRHREYGPDLAT